MNKIEAQALIKVWVARRDAATAQTGRPQIALLVEEAQAAFRRANYQLVGQLLSEDALRRQLALY